MIPCRLKLLFTPLENLTNLLRPCTSELFNYHQQRNVRIAKNWPNDWIPFEWKKPELLPGYFESGDRKEGLDKYDLTRIKPSLENLEILKNAPESVRKLYTLRYLRRNELKAIQTAEYESKLPIRRRVMDKDYYEKKVIRFTVSIRHLRDCIRNEAPGSAGLKIACSLCINKRYKFLCELYRMDREQCEMLCEKLGIDFKEPKPYYWPYPFVERKRTIRETCENYCKQLKQKKLESYKEKLREDQVKFADEKAEKLKWIEKTMAEFKITEDMLTDTKPPLHIAASYIYLE